MALQKARNLKNTTIELPNAYIRIDAFRFDKPDRAWVQLGVYENEAAATPQDITSPVDEEQVVGKTNPMPIETVEVSLSVENDLGGKASVSMGQLYAAIKTRDEWSDATDV